LSVKIQEIIDKARSENRTFLLEPESKQIMKILEITTTEYQVATDKSQAKVMARKIGFPVVMKIVSPQVIHKTDAGGVKLKKCSKL